MTDIENARVIYRPVTSADMDSLVNLLGNLGYPMLLEDVAARLESIEANGGLVIVADYDGVVVGCVNARVDVRLAEGVSGEIATLVVAESHRGKGLGKGLVSEAQHWLHAKGCKRIRVRANTIRKNAHRFYLGLGFIELKTQKVFSTPMAD